MPQGIRSVVVSKPSSRNLRLVLFADYFQFYLADLHAHEAWLKAHGSDPELAPAGWTNDAVHRLRIGVEPYSISIGTERRDCVETEIEIHPSWPSPVPEAAVHVVETDLDVPSGSLTVYCIDDIPDGGERLRVTPGLYRLRVSHLPAGPLPQSQDYEVGPHLLYQLDLWRSTEPRAASVIKQGPPD